MWVTTSLYAWNAAMQPWAKSLSDNFEMWSQIHGHAAQMFKGWPLGEFYRHSSAAFHVAARGFKTYDRRPFDIESVEIDGTTYFVEEETVADKDFMRAIRFDLVDENGNKFERNAPETLMVAPMSGHFATLLRDTVKRSLTDGPVTITDWKNARNVPVSAGRFDLNTYKNYLIEMMQMMGRNTHVIGVCQPTVPLVAAVSQMAEDNDPAQPLSMTLMGGPLHPSANITEPVQLAKDNDMFFFRNLTGLVPTPYKGAGRAVYPGFMQLAGFIAMNEARHQQSVRDFFDHLIAGDEDSAEAHRKFYDEYLAVMDMPAEFYLETIEKGFINEDLANGRLELGGRIIDPSKITKTAVMTVEGGADDIAAPGQTIAVHRLLANLPANMKFAHFEPKAGHYGIFAGSKWRERIAPKINAFKHLIAAQNGIKYDTRPDCEPQSWNDAWREHYAPQGGNVTHLRPAA